MSRSGVAFPVAIRLSGDSDQPRLAKRGSASPPSARIFRLPRHFLRGEAERSLEGGHSTHIPAQLRHPSDRSRLRHPRCLRADGAGTFRSPVVCLTWDIRMTMVSKHVLHGEGRSVVSPTDVNLSNPDTTQDNVRALSYVVLDKHQFCCRN